MGRRGTDHGIRLQVLRWAHDAALQLPVVRRNLTTRKIAWRPAAYHTVLQILRHPIYAGAYVFGRRTQRKQTVDGRARKTMGHSTTMAEWKVLLRDHHPGYISARQPRRFDREHRAGGAGADRREQTLETGTHLTIPRPAKIIVDNNGVLPTE